MAINREDLKTRLDDSLDQLNRNGQIEELKIEFGVSRDTHWPVSCRFGIRAH